MFSIDNSFHKKWNFFSCCIRFVFSEHTDFERLVQKQLRKWVMIYEKKLPAGLLALNCKYIIIFFRFLQPTNKICNYRKKTHIPHFVANIIHRSINHQTQQAQNRANLLRCNDQSQIIVQWKNELQWNWYDIKLINPPCHLSKYNMKISQS